MTDPRRPEAEREVLLHDASDRLFARAAELDAVEKAGADVEKLRAAAVEAGISRSAFDAALDEMHDVPDKVVRRSSSRGSRMKARIIGTSALIVAIVLGLLARSPTPITINSAVRQELITSRVEIRYCAY